LRSGFRFLGSRFRFGTRVSVWDSGFGLVLGGSVSMSQPPWHAQRTQRQRGAEHGGGPGVGFSSGFWLRARVLASDSVVQFGAGVLLRTRSLGSGFGSAGNSVVLGVSVVLGLRWCPAFSVVLGFRFGGRWFSFEIGVRFWVRGFGLGPGIGLVVGGSVSRSQPLWRALRKQRQRRAERGGRGVLLAPRGLASSARWLSFERGFWFGARFSAQGSMAVGLR
jgi:hypothetical protein